MESAGTHFDGGDCEMAIEIYSEILSRGGELTAPECAAVYNKRGLCYERASDWDRALEDYNAAIEQLVPSEWNHHMDTSCILCSLVFLIWRVRGAIPSQPMQTRQ